MHVYSIISVTDILLADIVPVNGKNDFFNHFQESVGIRHAPSTNLVGKTMVCGVSQMKINVQKAGRLFGAVIYVAMLLMAASSRAQNLLVSSAISSGYVTQIQQGGATNVYATGFNYPTAMAFDNKGDLFVLNFGSGNIIEVMPGGTQIPFAAGFSSPHGMAMDNSNNVFVADQGNSRVEEFTSGGTAITVVSNVSVQCVALDSAGNLYVANTPSYENYNILEFTNMNGSYGTNSCIFASSLPYPPLAMVFNSVGDLFVDIDSGGSGILEITPDGRQNNFAPAWSGSWPVQMAFDSSGNLYVSDLDTGSINEYTPGGAESTYISGLNAPSGLAFQPVATPPTLGIAPAGNRSVLFWPAANGNFLLQSITNLGSTNWTTVSNSILITGFMVTNAPPSQFFRLEQY